MPCPFGCLIESFTISYTCYDRHLAGGWATYIVSHFRRRLGAAATEPSGVEHLILDLLGTANPKIRSFFPDTGWFFDALAHAEMRLHDAGLLRETDGSQQAQWGSFFVPWIRQELSQGDIGDDHVPFLSYGVNVLRVIPEPFPSV